MKMVSTWNGHRYSEDIDKRTKRAIAVYTSEWRRYAEPYVRFQTGATMKSAHMASDIEHGLVIYDTPYARYTYFNTSSKVTTDHHPSASALWGKVALDRHHNQMWIRAMKEYNR